MDLIKSIPFWLGVAAFLVGAGTGLEGLATQNGTIGIIGSVMLALGAGVTASVVTYKKEGGKDERE